MLKITLKDGSQFVVDDDILQKEILEAKDDNTIQLGNNFFKKSSIDSIYNETSDISKKNFWNIIIEGSFIVLIFILIVFIVVKIGMLYTTSSAVPNSVSLDMSIDEQSLDDNEVKVGISQLRSALEQAYTSSYPDDLGSFDSITNNINKNSPSEVSYSTSDGGNRYIVYAELSDGRIFCADSNGYSGYYQGTTNTLKNKRSC